MLLSVHHHALHPFDWSAIDHRPDRGTVDDPWRDNNGSHKREGGHDPHDPPMRMSLMPRRGRCRARSKAAQSCKSSQCQYCFPHDDAPA